jgi:hypothetical protein
VKILFDNKAKGAAFSALNESSAFPASNLVHPFARYKYKALTPTDTITVTLPDNVSASCFFYTYSNATSMTLRVYSHTSALLETVSIDCTHDSGSAFFTRHDNARSFTLTVACDAAEDLYIGSIGFGLATDFPYPLANFEKDLIDLSSKEVSDGGQVSYHYSKPLTSYSLTFNRVKRDSVFHGIITQFLGVGSGYIWADITETNHEYYQPMYCTTKLVESPSRDRYLVSFKLTLTEAR